MRATVQVLRPHTHGGRSPRSIRIGIAYRGWPGQH
jgi:hypothetical protein